MLISILFILGLNGQVALGAWLDSTGCEYNGKILDSSKTGGNYISKVPENFSGLIICKHSENGNVYRRMNFKNGLENGLQQVYDSAGKLDSETQMRAGKKHGTMKKYDSRTKKLTHEWNYVDGKETGVQRDYHAKTGTIQRIQNARSEKGGSRLEFNEAGNLMELQCGAISASTQDIAYCGRHGLSPRVDFFDDKNRRRKSLTYKNGQLDGWVISYDDDGKVRNRALYKAGQEVSYEETGKMKEEKGKDGSVTRTSFFSDGKIMLVQVLKGEDVLSETEYYQNGAVARESKQSGPWTEVKTFFDDKKPACRARYQEEGWVRKYDGENICLTQDGKKAYEEKYVNGAREGEQNYYGPNGAILRKALFSAGVPKTFFVYDDKGTLLEKYDVEPDGSRKL